jgi:hypothetical protein
VKAAFVTLPVHESYARFMNRDAWKKSKEVIQAMVRQGAVSYHNYLEDRRFTVGDFHDHDHLSTAGAAKMTRILDEEVVKAALPP